MQKASKDQFDQLRLLDSPTIFNAIVEVSNTTGGGQPVCYTGQTLKSLTPDLGCVVGYAVTSEVTTNDDDSPNKKEEFNPQNADDTTAVSKEE